MPDLSNFTADQTWLHNPRWRSGPALAHGTLTKRGLPAEGKLPLSRAVAAAAPAFEALLRDGGDWKLEAIIGADQVHGDRVSVVSDPADLEGAKRIDLDDEEDAEATRYHVFAQTDALITTLPRHLLVIQTADCLPILFWDAEARVVGACHCGWRGLFSGLAGKTALAMAESGARPKRMEAWIGPGICAGNYEVGSELIEKFQAEFPGVALAHNGGTHLNLAEVARAQLRAAGLADSHIHNSAECTFADGDLYHSYRRDGPRAGRLLTVIAMKG